MKTLSDKIQDGERWLGEPIDFILKEDVKQSIKNIKQKWREKCKRMKIMSGEVAIFELECLLKSELGNKLIEEKEE